MKTTSVKKVVVLLMFVSLLAVSCLKSQQNANAPSAPNAPTAKLAVAPGCGPVTFTIDPKSNTPPWIPPTDIPGGAGSANLQSASVFAWQEFIALNWPAVPQTGQLNTRDQPDPNAIFGDPKYSGPLVWHTYRHKSEIFPGTLTLPSPPPHGYVNDPSKYYGYDQQPQYIYTPNATADPSMQQWIIPNSGQIPPFNGTPSTTTPWINLDEQSEIGLDTMYAGNAPTDPFPMQQILFLAKANRAEYAYVAANGWWTQQTDAAGNITFPPISATENYISSVAKNPQQYVDPPPGSTTQPGPANQLISFPNNTIEVKSGWRQLTPKEAGSGRFYTTTVRYYNAHADGPQAGQVGYVDAVWGLVALHIIQKTPTAPYFIYATFSQADNLLDSNGNRIEDENGNLLGNNGANDPLTPNVTSQNATPTSIQVLSPPTSPVTSPGSQVYFVNTPTTPPPPPTTQGIITLNRREHNIPQCIIDVNTAAHAAIVNYSQQHNITNSVWQYYKLVNVQYQPYDKPAGTTYTGAAGGPDPSTYYQANEMVETDYNLQVFSGRFQPDVPGRNVQKLITDYNNDGTPFHNTYYSTYAPGSGKAANMGGCMGCHANAQVAGSDFSFILLGGPVQAPEVATGHQSTSAIGIAKFHKLLLRK
jgi:hypothetical protein